MTEQNDIEVRKKAAQCLLDFIEPPRVEKEKIPSNYLNLLKVLAKKILESDGQEAGCSTHELEEKGVSRGDAPKSINKIYQDLSKDKVFCDKLKKFAKENGLSFYPWIDKKTGGGRGKHTHYFLVPKTFSEELIETEESDFVNQQSASITNTDEITYVREPPSPSKWWTRMTDDFVFTGWRQWLYIFFILLPIFSIVIVIYLYSLLFAIFSTVIVIAIVICFYPLFFIIFYGIIQYFFFPSVEYVYIELTPPEERGKSGKPVRKLQWSTYSGKCPICKDEVIIDHKFFFRGLIGRCIRNPRQHVFDFDHTTLRGKRL